MKTKLKNLMKLEKKSEMNLIVLILNQKKKLLIY